MKSGWIVALAALASCVVAPTASAAGRIEINQTRALAGGITTSDAPGFPVTLDAPGSYVLTGDLDLTTASPNLHAIEILTPLHTENITIDLGGFEIAGPASCSGFADFIVCTNTGTGNGIEATGASEVIVLNGKIRNMGQHGIDIWGTGRVDGVTAKHNAGDGVRVGFGSSVADVIARDNAGDGVRAGDGSLVRNSVGIGNGGRGVAIGVSSSATSCSARDNGGHGIEIGLHSTLTDASISLSRGNGLQANGDNVVRGVSSTSNTGKGIFLSSGLLVDAVARLNGDWGISVSIGTIEGCDSRQNTSRQVDGGNGTHISGCHVEVNNDIGILVTARSRVVGNVITGVGGTGTGILVSGVGNHIEGNTVIGLSTGIGVQGTQNLIVSNRASNNTTPYDIAAGNTSGSIVDLGAPGGTLPDGKAQSNLVY